MSDLVDPTVIEDIVGMVRDSELHYARAVSAGEMVYVLHSQHCLDTVSDLRDCVFSQALDKGINMDIWSDCQDQPVAVTVDVILGLVPINHQLLTRLAQARDAARKSLDFFVDEGGLPSHLPMGVTKDGQGPEDDSVAHHFVCWCGSEECMWNKALAWARGEG